MVVAVTTLIATLLINHAVHEAGHAWAMRGFGITVSHVRLGLPLPRNPHSPRRRYWFAIYERLGEMPYRDRASILNAGTVANLILGFGLLAIAGAGRGNLLYAALLFALAALCWWAQRIVAAYVLPALAVPVLVLLATSDLRGVASGEAKLGYPDVLPVFDLLPSGPVGVVECAGLVALVVAIAHVQPLIGLDNARVVDLLLDRWLRCRNVSVYRAVGLALVFALLALATPPDVHVAIPVIVD